MGSLLVMDAEEKKRILGQIESEGLYAVVTGDTIGGWGGDG